MPVTRSRTGLYGSDLDQTGTARFLFGEEDASGEHKYGQGTDDNFPTLVRRDDQMVSREFFFCLVPASHCLPAPPALPASAIVRCPSCTRFRGPEVEPKLRK